MNLGFVYNQKRVEECKRLGKESWRATLKFAWFPKQVINEAINGPYVVTAEQLQWIWLDYYSIVEHYNQSKRKWIRNHVQPFINPDEKSLKEIRSEEFKETPSSWFKHWEDKKSNQYVNLPI